MFTAARKLDRSATAIAFSPDDRWLAIGRDTNGEVILWDVATGHCTRMKNPPSAPVRCLAFRPDAGLLASGHTDDIVRLWDVAMRRELVGFRSATGAAAFSPDGRSLAVPGCLYELNAAGRQVGWRELSGHRLPVSSMAFSRDGRVLASADAESVRLWDATSCREIRCFDAPSNAANAAISPDGRWVACSGGHSKGGVVRIFDTEGRQEARTFSGHEGFVFGVAFSANGVWLASASEDKTVRLWDPATGREVAALREELPVRWVAFSADSDWVASAFRTVRLWRRQSQEAG